MRLFLYEFVTGGGLWHWPQHAPTGSLLAEGRAMIQALALDFAKLADLSVVTTQDSRLPMLHPASCEVTLVASAQEERQAFQRLAAKADWTLLIAPETEGALLERCRLVEPLRRRLLSPSAACVELAANKQATAQHLARRGIRVPAGAMIDSPQNLPSSFTFPCVLKPVDGCGSQGVRLVQQAGELDAADFSQPRRIEPLVPGLAVSVGVLCGPAGNHALPACEQRLEGNGSFVYLGGKLPLDSQFDERARGLALAAAGSLPQPLGYIGVDLVLGSAPDGSRDYVIEINPRLTTSYVGLRAAARTNLAAALLAVAQGAQPDLRFDGEALEFTADGKIHFG